MTAGVFFETRGADALLPVTAQTATYSCVTQAATQTVLIRRAMDVNRSLAGKLLIALPSMGDARFRQAVILVCTHNEDHAMGLVLNRAADNMRLPELLDQMGVDGDQAPEDMHVLLGGPVGRERGFVLHSDDYDSDGATLPILDGVCLTATKDILHAMASDSPPVSSKPNSRRMSGWWEKPTPRWSLIRPSTPSGAAPSPASAYPPTVCR